MVGMNRPDGTILAEATSSVGLNSVQSPSVPPLPPCKFVVIYRVKRRLQSELAKVSERSKRCGDLASGSPAVIEVRLRELGRSEQLGWRRGDDPPSQLLVVQLDLEQSSLLGC